MPADGAAAGVLVLEYLRFQRPGQRQDSPPKPLAADRKGNRLRAGVGVAIVKGDTSPVVVIAALPANEGIGLLALPGVIGAGPFIPLSKGGKCLILIAYPSFLLVFGRPWDKCTTKKCNPHFSAGIAFAVKYTLYKLQTCNFAV